MPKKVGHLKIRGDSSCIRKSDISTLTKIMNKRNAFHLWRCDERELFNTEISNTKYFRAAGGNEMLKNVLENDGGAFEIHNYSLTGVAIRVIRENLKHRWYLVQRANKKERREFLACM